MPLDALALYNAWNLLDNAASAQLRRVAEPDELKDIPAFYHLVQPFGWPEHQHALLRIVFCLTAGKKVIQHVEKTEAHPKGISLGKALAESKKINERRVYQLLRAEWPNDLIQLRRLLVHAEPKLYWPLFVEQMTWWNQSARRQLLEDFVLALPSKKNT